MVPPIPCYFLFHSIYMTLKNRFNLFLLELTTSAQALNWKIAEYIEWDYEEQQFDSSHRILFLILRKNKLFSERALHN